ncbi:sucrose-specific PTS transporter subunit IIBC [Bacillus vallismortis]|uniref:sucrose-specific PTS transporter subunit IIBC n=1 Tax=Bacillus vallismortis TaxID=72361 RepID=UPI002DBF606C|nr:sucrose-specific PTS transporter subunit IIBC [Bacillus vallismortis]MEC1268028.1 sucrose-specific PTS transporter subunit IIBC [Bacillus vallismortis]
MQKEIANELLVLIGGKSNIISISHCTTRLRFEVKDETKIDIHAIKQLQGVQGTFFRYGLFQIIFGAGVVNKIYKELIHVWENAPSEEPGQQKSSSRKQKSSSRKLNPVAAFAKTLSDIFVPIIPAITASGLLMGLIGMIKVFHWFAAGSPWIKMLDLVSSTAFILLPILVGFSAARQFGSNPYLGAVIAGLLTHPDLLDPSMLGSKTPASLDIWGLHIPMMGYQGSIIPILFSVYVMSRIEKLLKSIVPKSLDVVIIPFTTILMTGFLALIVMNPAASIIGQIMTQSIVYIYDHAGIAAGALFGGIYSTIVLSGLHHSFYAIEATLLADPHVGVNFLVPIWSMANVAQGGAGLAVFFKTKQSSLKKIALPASLTAFLGIVEPIVFGVNVKLIRPFIGAAIGGAIGGAYVVAVHVVSNSYGLTGIPMISIVLPFGAANFVHYMIGFLAAAVSAFIATLFLGFKEETE